MTDLINQIRAAQVRAAEDAVCDNLRAQGLLPSEDATTKPVSASPEGAQVEPMPPLPEPKTRYLCMKCGQSTSDTPEHHRPFGPKCDYLAVAYVDDKFTADQMNARYLEGRRSRGADEATIQQAIEALERMVDPIKWEREHLAEGYDLNYPMLLSMIDKSQYYQGIAKETLAALTSLRSPAEPAEPAEPAGKVEARLLTDDEALKVLDGGYLSPVKREVIQRAVLEKNFPGISIKKGD